MAKPSTSKQRAKIASWNWWILGSTTHAVMTRSLSFVRDCQTLPVMLTQRLALSVLTFTETQTQEASLCPLQTTGLESTPNTHGIQGLRTWQNARA